MKLKAPSNVGSIKSSSVAIGAASAFLVLSGVLGLTSERHDLDTLRSVEWTLRGTIIPGALAAPGNECGHQS